MGISAILLALLQPLNAYLRPPKPLAGEPAGRRRLIWQWIHKFSGHVALAVGSVALISGIFTLGMKYEEHDFAVETLAWLMLAWILLLILLLLYLEKRCGSRNR